MMREIGQLLQVALGAVRAGRGGGEDRSGEGRQG